MEKVKSFWSQLVYKERNKNYNDQDWNFPSTTQKRFLLVSYEDTIEDARVEEIASFN